MDYLYIFVIIIFTNMCDSMFNFNTCSAIHVRSLDLFVLLQFERKKDFFSEIETCCFLQTLSFVSVFYLGVPGLYAEILPRGRGQTWGI